MARQAKFKADTTICLEFVFSGCSTLQVMMKFNPSNRELPIGDEKFGELKLTKNEILNDFDFKTPIDFSLILEDKKEYSSKELYSCINEYYTPYKHIQDFQGEYFDQWKSAFINEYQKADDKLAVVVKHYEKIHNYYRRSQIENPPDTETFFEYVYPYQLKGFQAQGHKELFLDSLLKSDSILIGIDDIKENHSKDSTQIKFANLYCKLINLNAYIEGFSRKSFLHWVSSNYSMNDGNVLPEKVESKFKGLPEYIYSYLPNEIKDNLKDIEYSPKLIWQLLFKYYGNTKVTGFLHNYLDGWEKDFIERIEHSLDKNQLIKKVLNKHDYSFRTTQSHGRKTEGYDSAIDGLNPEINTLIKYPEWIFDADKMPSRYKNSNFNDELYKDIRRFFYEPDEFIEGYAHACFQKLVKNYLKNKSSLRTNTAKTSHTIVGAVQIRQ